MLNGVRDFDSPAGSAESDGPFYGGGRVGLPATWCLPTQRLPFREDDQQARLINGAFDGWLHSSWRSQKKAPPKRG
jgi:hypothetical protein